MALGRIVDGLIFVSIKGYLQGQDDISNMYLAEALRQTGGVWDDGGWGDGSDGTAALRLKHLVDSNRASGAAALKEAAMLLPSSWRFPPLREIRDSVGASNARRYWGKDGDLGAKFDNK